MEGSIDRRGRWATAAGLIALTGVAAVLRLPGLNQGLWYDEIMTIVLSLREPLTSIVQRFPSNNVHPLYSVLGRLSIVALGEHAWTIRLPAVLFGVACIPLMYATALEVASRREALFSAAILAVSYQHVWFSQNARGYSALAFWTLLCTWLFFRARRRNSYGLQTAYACAAALGVYTHMTMGFIIATHALIVAGRQTLGTFGEAPANGSRNRSRSCGCTGLGLPPCSQSRSTRRSCCKCKRSLQPRPPRTFRSRPGAGRLLRPFVD